MATRKPDDQTPLPGVAATFGRALASRRDEPGPSGSRASSRSVLESVPSLSLPKGGGAIRGIGEKVGVNPATGTASFSMPLPFSPGRGGAPDLSLRYDSGAGAGPFGWGGRLALPTISYRTDRGLPRYLDDDAHPDTFVFAGDVVLTIRYSAERGGDKFGAEVSNQVVKALGKLKQNADGEGPYQLVSLRHDFPDAWYRYQAGQGLTLALSTEILPFALRSGMKPALAKVHAIRLPKDAPAAPEKDIPIVTAPAGWSLAVEPAAPPENLDDIYLLTRFTLS